MSKRSRLVTIILAGALCAGCVAADEEPVLDEAPEPEEAAEPDGTEHASGGERELLEPPEVEDDRDPAEQNQRADIGIVCMYSDWWYRGRELCFYVHRQTCGGVPDFRAYGFNDVASSIRVQAGVHAYIYKHGHYTGEYSAFYDWDAWLGDNTIGNDQATSLWFCYW